VVLPPFEVADDVFPHHDGVVDEEPDGQERAMRVITFRVMPRKFMTVKAEMTEMGRVRPVITVERQELRSRRR